MFSNYKITLQCTGRRSNQQLCCPRSTTVCKRRDHGQTGYAVRPGCGYCGQIEPFCGIPEAIPLSLCAFCWETSLQLSADLCSHRPDCVRNCNKVGKHNKQRWHITSIVGKQLMQYVPVDHVVAALILGDAQFCKWETMKQHWYSDYLHWYLNGTKWHVKVKCSFSFRIFFNFFSILNCCYRSFFLFSSLCSCLAFFSLI